MNATKSFCSVAVRLSERISFESHALGTRRNATTPITPHPAPVETNKFTMKLTR
jgi:hypothetical protein